MAKSKEKRAKRETKTEGEGESEGVTNTEESKALPVKIKVLDDNPENKAAPIIGYFPSGYDPFGEDGECRAKIYRNENRSQKNPRMQVVVDVSGCRVNMIGTSFSGEATMPQLCNYALGVFDKDAGVLKMVPIAANKIFRLDPQFDEGELDANVEHAEAEQEGKEKEKDPQSALKEYWSKKDIRRDEKYRILRRTDDSEVPGNTSEKLDGIEINTTALQSIKSGTVEAVNIPPYDMEARTADRAYPLENIILQGEWSHLLDIFDILQAGSERNLEHYPSFVCNRINQLEIIKDETNRKRIAGILSYITHLINFKDRFSIEGVSSATRRKIPSIFTKKFASMFGTAAMANKRIPEAKHGLLVSYILVLSLFVDDFRTDPSDIAKDLRMDPVTVRRHYEYLGCKFVRENRILLATLSVPLELRNVKRKRRR